MTGLRLLTLLKRKPAGPVEQDQVHNERQHRQETKRHSSFLQRGSVVVCSEDDGGDEEQEGDEEGEPEVQTGPADDGDPGVQAGGEDDEQQHREEERRAAHKLKEVEGEAADATADHLLQEEGHEGEDHFSKFDHEPDSVEMLRWNQTPGRLRVRSRGGRVDFRSHDGASLFSGSLGKQPSLLRVSAGEQTSDKQIGRAHV